jgi:hypothetical protein
MSSISKDKRGFSALIGKTIMKVNTRAINVVILEDEFGNKYEIDSEQGPLQIPVLTLRLLNE